MFKTIMNSDYQGNAETYNEEGRIVKYERLFLYAVNSRSHVLFIESEIIICFFNIEADCFKRKSTSIFHNFSASCIIGCKDELDITVITAQKFFQIPDTTVNIMSRVKTVLHTHCSCCARHRMHYYQKKNFNQLFQFFHWLFLIFSTIIGNASPVFIGI